MGMGTGPGQKLFRRRRRLGPGRVQALALGPGPGLGPGRVQALALGPGLFPGAGSNQQPDFKL